MKRATRPTNDHDFAHHMSIIAPALLGEPNRRLSRGADLRFGANGSMAVNVEKGTFYSHEDKLGGGVLDLIWRIKGLKAKAAVDWMRDELRLDVSAGFRTKANGAPPGLRKIIATYPYVDERGKLLFEVVRYRPKTFRQRRPDGAGGWVWSVQGVRQVPYRLPELLEAISQGRKVAIVEGEKDADALWKLNIPATTNAGGAGKWSAELCKYLRDANVVAVADNDDAGRAHVLDVASMLDGFATEVGVLELPGLPPKGDASVWIEAGGTAESFWDLVEAHAKPCAKPATTVGARVPGREISAPEGSDEALALQFAQRHADELRFVAFRNKWLCWERWRWVPDETLHSFNCARAICREQAARCKEKAAAAVASARTVFAVERLARADRRLAATEDQWDGDPDIINTAPTTEITK